jgi:hypothetical protein
MSTQDKPPEIIIDYYKFKNFYSVGENSVIFNVECTKDANEANKAEIESLLKDIGKWDCLVSLGVFLLSDLKNIHLLAPKNNPEKYLTKFGVDLYKPAVITLGEKAKETDNLPLTLKVTIELNETELQKRRDLQMYPTLKQDEIMKQVENIPKWIVFQKFLSSLRKASVL